MAARKTTSERIAELQEKEAQLRELMKQLKKRESEEQRKARTRRLIQIGAEVESVLGHPIEPEELPMLRKFLLDQEKRGRYFSKAMKRDKETGDDQSVGEAEPEQFSEEERPAEEKPEDDFSEEEFAEFEESEEKVPTYENREAISEEQKERKATWGSMDWLDGF